MGAAVRALAPAAISSRGIDWCSKQIDDVGIIGAPAPARPLLLDMPAGSSSAALMRSLPALAPASRSLNEPMRIAHCGTRSRSRSRRTQPLCPLWFGFCDSPLASGIRQTSPNSHSKINTQMNVRIVAWLGSLQRMRLIRGRLVLAEQQRELKLFISSPFKDMQKVRSSVSSGHTTYYTSLIPPHARSLPLPAGLGCAGA